MDQDELQEDSSIFLEWVGRILPTEKMESWKTLFQAPCETNELTESIFGELSRVFNADNPRTAHNFTDSKDSEDYEEFLTEKKTSKFWQNEYWKEIQTHQNSYIITDLPTKQTTPRPEPYFYIVDIHCLIDIEVNIEGTVEYIAYWLSPGKVMVIDELSWKVYEIPREGEEETYDLDKAILQSEVFHNLGRTPAQPVYFNPISKETTLVSHNPISKSLGALDWLLFFKISKKDAETSVPYPIFVTYTEAENSESETREKETMDYGMTLPDGVEFVPYSQINPGPKNKRKFNGPGTLIQVDPPKDSSDSDLMRNPVQVIVPSTESLEYIDTQIDKRDAEIFSNCVGKDGDVVNDQAVNELQVEGTYESKKNILKKIASRIERVMKFQYEIMGLLRYGKRFKSSDVSLGDEWYLTTIQTKQEDYKLAKATGMPSYEIGNQLHGLWKDKYRDQPDILSRNQILYQIEPFPSLTIEQVAELVGKGLADETKFLLKVDFESYVQRFEREQMPVTVFGSSLAPANKIRIITDKLLEYAKEENPDSPSKQVEQSSAPGA